MIILMIKYYLFCKSNHWPPRLKKINKIIDNILKYKNELNFNVNINYKCNIILTNNKLLEEMNYKYKKKKYPTDVLTFVSAIENKRQKKKKYVIFFYLLKS